MTLGPGIQEWTNGMDERDEQKTATKKAGNSAAAASGGGLATGFNWR